MGFRFPHFFSRTGFATRLCGLAFLLFASSTLAATLTVTNTNDSGAGSLRQAIADAADGDTITFAVTGTITLTSGELAFSKSLAIQGPGSQLLTISGNKASRVFLINGGTTSLSGLSISNGNAGSSFLPGLGGGLLALNGTLNISNAAITNNQGVNGGGMFLAQGTFNFLNTRISGNTSEFQGAAANLQDANTTMDRCHIIGNISQKSQGGIVNLAANFPPGAPVGSLLLIRSTVEENISQANLGAVWTVSNSNAATATTTLENTTVINNSPRNFLTSPTTLVPTPNARLISQGNNIDGDNTSGFINGRNGDKVFDLRICFADASRWCNRLQIIGDKHVFTVVIPGVNSNQPVRTFLQGAVNPIVRSYLGCGGYVRFDVRSKLIAAYIAAQLSVQEHVPLWFYKQRQQLLVFHVVPPQVLPVEFNGGPSLSPLSSLQELFDATEWVVAKGTLADQQKLLAVYNQLNTCLN